MVNPSVFFAGASVLGAAVPGLSAISRAIASLYGVVSDLNAYIDRHIAEMKASNNPTIERTGRVLEMAKFGFGMGYLTSVTVLAVGQYLLGNTFAAVSTLATAASFSNPIAMTCGAVGAIVYGWGALSDAERNEILTKLADGLELGVEFIRSVVAFVLSAAKELFSPPLLKELKVYIGDMAALFGRSLSDVTGKAVDLISDTAGSARRNASRVVNAAAKVASDASDKVGETLTDIGQVAGRAVDQTAEVAQQVIAGGRDVVRRSRSGKSEH